MDPQPKEFICSTNMFRWLRQLPTSVRALLLFIVACCLLYPLPTPLYPHSDSSVQLPPTPLTPARPSIDLDAELKALVRENRRIKGIHSTILFPDPKLTTSQELRYAHLQHEAMTMQDRGVLHQPISPNSTRWNQWRESARPPTGKIMLVATLKDVEDLLPDLINTMVILTFYLGPERISISITEGPSKDHSAAMLEDILRPALLRLGVRASDIELKTNRPNVEWSYRNRIEALAELRNEALAPLWEDNKSRSDSSPLESPTKVNSSDSEEVPVARTVGKDIDAVVFFNDLYLSAYHILELLHQHVRAEVESGETTGMTTAMDYRECSDDRKPCFYDVWVGRLVETGGLFRPFGKVDSSSNLFEGQSDLQGQYDDLKPFPVFCAWNGIAVINPKVFLPPHNLRFRRSDMGAGECSSSECSLFCSDLWSIGMGRIQTIPSVRVAYKERDSIRINEQTAEARLANGWEDGVPPAEKDESVVWPSTPPAQVVCYPWPERLGTKLWPWRIEKWVPPWLGHPFTESNVTSGEV